MQREHEAPVLVTTIASVRCAIPVTCVVETMRPLSTERGSARHRGTELCVLDATELVNGVPAVAPRRVVILRAGPARIALLVENVHGVRGARDSELGARAFATLDPALGPDVVAVLGDVRVLVGDA